MVPRALGARHAKLPGLLYLRITLLTTHYSLAAWSTLSTTLLTTPLLYYSLLTTHYSLLTTHDSLLTTQARSYLPTYYLLITYTFPTKAGGGAREASALDPAAGAHRDRSHGDRDG